MAPAGVIMKIENNILKHYLKNVVAIMLSPQSMSINNFFDRTDPEKQFLFTHQDTREETCNMLAHHFKFI